MNPAHAFLSTILAASLSAQVTERLHLPAGDWSLRDLVHHAELALRTPIAADDSELQLAADQRVHMQLPVAVDLAGGRDAITALLAARGLLLLPAAGGGLQARLVAGMRPAEITDAAVAVSVQQLFRDPHHAAIVRVSLPTAAEAGGLRALLSVAAAAVPLVHTEKVADGVQLTGPAADVRESILMLAPLAPDVLAQLPAPPGSVVGAKPTRAVDLAAGEHTVVEAIDALASAQGVNIVMPTALRTEDRRVHVPAGLQIATGAGARALAKLLWQEGVLLLELDAAHGLHEAIVVDHARQRPAGGRAQRRTLRETAADEGFVMFTAVFVPSTTVAPEKVMVAMRRFCGAAGARGIASGVGLESGVLLIGAAPDLAAVLQATGVCE